MLFCSGTECDDPDGTYPTRFDFTQFATEDAPFTNEVQLEILDAWCAMWAPPTGLIGFTAPNMRAVFYRVPGKVLYETTDLIDVKEVTSLVALLKQINLSIV